MKLGGICEISRRAALQDVRESGVRESGNVHERDFNFGTLPESTKDVKRVNASLPNSSHLTEGEKTLKVESDIERILKSESLK